MSTNQPTNCSFCNAKYTNENKPITRNDVSLCTMCVDALKCVEKKEEECDNCGEDEDDCECSQDELDEAEQERERQHAKDYDTDGETTDEEDK